MNAIKRPLFLIDVAEELTWLNQKAGPEVAERWFNALIATLEFIEKHPLAGRGRKDLTPPNIRSWRVRGFPRWLIFYEVTAKKDIVFHRIRAANMNLVVLKMKS